LTQEKGILYSEITETPGVGASGEQLSMLATRYELAVREGIGNRLLEVACGTGIGLGFLAERYEKVVGCDIDATNVQIAAASYSKDSRIRIEQKDALNLDYPEDAFDTMLCFEAIYYFRDLPRFLKEARRILSPNGRLLLCSVNPHWSGFNPSPYSTRYWSPGELDSELRTAGFCNKMWCAFPDEAPGFAARVVRVIRAIAVRFHLIPRTMRGKVLLKKLFYRNVVAMPARLTPGQYRAAELLPLEPSTDRFPFKVFYVAATPLDGHATRSR
jgi:SAM-dependent methyltransferase